jgi:hypothetical protein
MKKILYNKKYGGFGFSNQLLERFGITDGQYSVVGYEFCSNIFNRTNPRVVEIVEEIGLEAASGELKKHIIQWVDLRKLIFR